jgi:transketolase
MIYTQFIIGDTELSFTEDVNKRFEAYGWHAQVITDGDNDLEGITNAIENAKKVTNKPSIIKIRTTIGIGSKHQGTEKVHGAPLAPDDIVEVKKIYGFNPEQFFYVPNEVYELYGQYREKGKVAEAQWNKLFEDYCAKFPAQVINILIV